MKLTPQQKLLRQFTDQSEKDLNQLIKELTIKYNLTYQQIRTIIKDYAFKYDGFNLDEFNKYDRKRKFKKDVIDIFGVSMIAINLLSKNTMKKILQDSYLSMGYVLEQATGKKIVTQRLSNEVLEELVYTDLDKEAIRINVISGKNSLNRDITSGLQLEQKITEVNRNVKDTLNKNANSHFRIDETTTTYNVSNGRMLAMEKASKKGIEVFKVWDAILDRKTRPSHASIDGDVKPMNGKFRNGLRYPRDPLGPAKETVRCRCDLTFIYGDGTLKEDYVDYKTWLEGIK